MLRFTFKFAYCGLALLAKVFLIIGGLVFSSLGNAFVAFLSSDSTEEAEETTSQSGYKIIGSERDAIEATHTQGIYRSWNE